MSPERAPLMDQEEHPKKGGGIVANAKDEDSGSKTISTIKELSNLTDLAVYQAQIGSKTRHARKPHPYDPWGYTREFLAKYGDAEHFDDIVKLFGEVGASDEV